jgi:hypothetical protein
MEPAIATVDGLGDPRSEGIENSGLIEWEPRHCRILKSWPAWTR